MHPRRIPDTAAKFWGGLLHDNPIAALTGTTYKVHKHGVPSENLPIPEDEGILIDNILLRNELPAFVSAEETFAIGSLLYVWPIDKLKEDMESKLTALNLVRDKKQRLRDLTQLGFEALAIVMVDLDCPNTEDFFHSIRQLLLDQFHDTDWIQFKTDNSFHIIFNQFVTPDLLPWFYGDLICKFSKLDPDGDKFITNYIGNQLKQNYSNREKIRELCSYILDNFTHYDTPQEEKFRSVLDIRWIAHSLLELLSYLEGNAGSFAFLRANNKPGSKKVPTALAYTRYESPQRSKTLATKSTIRQVKHFFN
ncbi:MAG: hypothetical protein UT34_C0002G0097 [candidate division WS6 bacterium GW2011_GWF2_39_15]|uniref:Uncharacterized protein n=1 Tax=candidate division WS6 bacterium GW2011_GWF2_39_15 TaxID=1619100 RepID=A0A0G0Q5D2_9BACT|nr:MAG: hypothetical protein UT34_C0002G0097 [candidate division WS6 bacterium GW2011_GWF2_39_15]